MDFIPKQLQNSVNFNDEHFDLLHYVCGTCLSWDRTLRHLDDDFQNITVLLGLKIPRTQKLCWECRAALKNTIRFRDIAIQAQKILHGKDWRFLPPVAGFSRLKRTKFVNIMTTIPTPIGYVYNDNADTVAPTPESTKSEITICKNKEKKMKNIPTPTYCLIETYDGRQFFKQMPIKATRLTPSLLKNDNISQKSLKHADRYFISDKAPLTKTPNLSLEKESVVITEDNAIITIDDDDELETNESLPIWNEKKINDDEKRHDDPLTTHVKNLSGINRNKLKIPTENKTGKEHASAKVEENLSNVYQTLTDILRRKLERTVKTKTPIDGSTIGITQTKLTKISADNTSKATEYNSVGNKLMMLIPAGNYTNKMTITNSAALPEDTLKISDGDREENLLNDTREKSSIVSEDHIAHLNDLIHDREYIPAVNCVESLVKITAKYISNILTDSLNLSEKHLPNEARTYSPIIKPKIKLYVPEDKSLTSDDEAVDLSGDEPLISDVEMDIIRTKNIVKEKSPEVTENSVEVTKPNFLNSAAISPKITKGILESIVTEDNKTEITESNLVISSAENSPIVAVDSLVNITGKLVCAIISESSPKNANKNIPIATEEKLQDASVEKSLGIPKFASLTDIISKKDKEQNTETCSPKTSKLKSCIINENKTINVIPTHLTGRDLPASTVKNTPAVNAEKIRYEKYELLKTKEDKTQIVSVESLTNITAKYVSAIFSESCFTMSKDNLPVKRANVENSVEKTIIDNELPKMSKELPNNNIEEIRQDKTAKVPTSFFVTAGKPCVTTKLIKITNKIMPLTFVKIFPKTAVKKLRTENTTTMSVSAMDKNRPILTSAIFKPINIIRKVNDRNVNYKHQFETNVPVNLHCNEDMSEIDFFPVDNGNKSRSKKNKKIKRVQGKPRKISRKQELVVRRITSGISPPACVNKTDMPFDFEQKKNMEPKTNDVCMYSPSDVFDNSHTSQEKEQNKDQLHNATDDELYEEFGEMVTIGALTENGRILEEHNYCKINTMVGNEPNKNDRLFLKDLINKTISNYALNNLVDKIVENLEDDEAQSSSGKVRKKRTRNKKNIAKDTAIKKTRIRCKSIKSLLKTTKHTENLSTTDTDRNPKIAPTSAIVNQTYPTSCNKLLNRNTNIANVSKEANLFPVEVKIERCQDLQIDVDDTLDWTVNTHQIEQIHDENEIGIDFKCDNSCDTLTASENEFDELDDRLSNISNVSDDNNDRRKTPEGYIRDDSPNYTDYEIKPLTDISEDSNVFENNLTICFSTSIFDSEENKIEDADITANIKEIENRNATPDLLEPLYFTDWKDHTFDHELENNSDGTTEGTTDTTKIKATNEIADSKKDTLKKRKRKTSDLQTTKISDRKKKKVASFNIIDGINFEKLLMLPVVVLERVDAKIPDKMQQILHKDIRENIIHDAENKTSMSSNTLNSFNKELLHNAAQTNTSKLDDLENNSLNETNDITLPKDESQLMTKDYNFRRKQKDVKRIYYKRNAMENNVQELMEMYRNREEFINEKNKCIKCVKTFDWPMFLKHHDAKYHKTGKYVCSICTSRFTDFASYSRHTSNDHKYNYTCNICEKTFMFLKDISKHIRIIHNIKITGPRPNCRKSSQDTFTCEICNRTCKDKGALDLHKLKHQKDKDDKDTRENSIHDGENTTSISSNSLNETNDITLPKDESEIMTKNECSKPKQNDVIYYTRVVMGKNDKNIMEMYRNREEFIKEKFKCIKCVKTFDKPFYLKKHNAKFHKKGKYVCSICTSRFTHYVRYTRHMYINHIDNYKCNICEKTFMFLKDVSKHIRIIHNIKIRGYRPRKTSQDTFTCEICNRTYKVKSALDLHKLKHQKDKDNKDLHNAAQANTSKLDENLEFNELEIMTKTKCLKPKKRKDVYYTRDAMGKNVQELMEMYRNREEFINEKHKCVKCVKTFDWPVYLERHNVKYHKKGKYECSICTSRFTDVASYSRHTSNDHKCHYTCNVCKNMFLNWKDVSKHCKLSHNIYIRPRFRTRFKQNFKCELCQKTYKYRGMLYHHKLKCHKDEDEIATQAKNLEESDSDIYEPQKNTKGASTLTPRNYNLRSCGDNTEVASTLTPRNDNSQSCADNTEVASTLTPRNDNSQSYADNTEVASTLTPRNDNSQSSADNTVVGSTLTPRNDNSQSCADNTEFASTLTRRNYILQSSADNTEVASTLTPKNNNSQSSADNTEVALTLTARNDNLQSCADNTVIASTLTPRNENSQSSADNSEVALTLTPKNDNSQSRADNKDMEIQKTKLHNIDTEMASTKTKDKLSPIKTPFTNIDGIISKKSSNEIDMGLSHRSKRKIHIKTKETETSKLKSKRICKSKHRTGKRLKSLEKKISVTGHRNNAIYNELDLAFQNLRFSDNSTKVEDHWSSDNKISKSFENITSAKEDELMSSENDVTLIKYKASNYLSSAIKNKSSNNMNTKENEINYTENNIKEKNKNGELIAASNGESTSIAKDTSGYDTDATENNSNVIANNSIKLENCLNSVNNDTSSYNYMATKENDDFCTENNSNAKNNTVDDEVDLNTKISSMKNCDMSKTEIDRSETNKDVAKREITNATDTYDALENYLNPENDTKSLKKYEDVSVVTENTADTSNHKMFTSDNHLSVENNNESSVNYKNANENHKVVTKSSLITSDNDLNPENVTNSSKTYKDPNEYNKGVTENTPDTSYYRIIVFDNYFRSENNDESINGRSENNIDVTENNSDATDNDLNDPKNYINLEKNDKSSKNCKGTSENNLDVTENNSDATDNDFNDPKNYINLDKNDKSSKNCKGTSENNLDVTENNSDATDNDFNDPKNYINLDKNDKSSKNCKGTSENNLDVTENNSDTTDNLSNPKQYFDLLNNVESSEFDKDTCENNVDVTENNSDEMDNKLNASDNNFTLKYDDLSSNNDDTIESDIDVIGNSVDVIHRNLNVVDDFSSNNDDSSDSDIDVTGNNTDAIDRILNALDNDSISENYDKPLNIYLDVRKNFTNATGRNKIFTETNLKPISHFAAPDINLCGDTTEINMIKNRNNPDIADNSFRSENNDETTKTDIHVTSSSMILTGKNADNTDDQLSVSNSDKSSKSYRHTSKNNAIYLDASKLNLVVTDSSTANIVESSKHDKDSSDTNIVTNSDTVASDNDLGASSNELLTYNDVDTRGYNKDPAENNSTALHTNIIASETNLSLANDGEPNEMDTAVIYMILEENSNSTDKDLVRTDKNSSLANNYLTTVNDRETIGNNIIVTENNANSTDGKIIAPGIDLSSADSELPMENEIKTTIRRSTVSNLVASSNELGEVNNDVSNVINTTENDSRAVRNIIYSPEINECSIDVAQEIVKLIAPQRRGRKRKGKNVWNKKKSSSIVKNNISLNLKKKLPDTNINLKSDIISAGNNSNAAFLEDPYSDSTYDVPIKNYTNAKENKIDSTETSSTTDNILDVSVSLKLVDNVATMKDIKIKKPRGRPPKNKCGPKQKELGLIGNNPNPSNFIVKPLQSKKPTEKNISSIKPKLNATQKKLRSGSIKYQLNNPGQKLKKKNDITLTNNIISVGNNSNVTDNILETDNTNISNVNKTLKNYTKTSNMENSSEDNLKDINPTSANNISNDKSSTENSPLEVKYSETGIKIKLSKKKLNLKQEKSIATESKTSFSDHHNDKRTKKILRPTRKTRSTVKTPNTTRNSSEKKSKKLKFSRKSVINSSSTDFSTDNSFKSRKDITMSIDKDLQPTELNTLSTGNTSNISDNYLDNPDIYLNSTSNVSKEINMIATRKPRRPTKRKLKSTDQELDSTRKKIGPTGNEVKPTGSELSSTEPEPSGSENKKHSSSYKRNLKRIIALKQMISELKSKIKKRKK